MEHQDELTIERNDRLALERERRRLTKALYEKGVITREALERELGQPIVLQLQGKDAP